jgi:predicted nucleic acid-binding protein
MFSWPSSPRSWSIAKSSASPLNSDPGELGTLDAIHLASALSLGEDLGGLLSYDRRLLDAAAVAGLPTLAPT